MMSLYIEIIIDEIYLNIHTYHKQISTYHILSTVGQSECGCCCGANIATVGPRRAGMPDTLQSWALVLVTAIVPEPGLRFVIHTGPSEPES